MLLLAIIYLAFIGLGLPDSLLGAAWPVMVLDLQTELSAAGVLSMVITGCTIISSLLSDRMTRKFGTGPVTAVSVAMTACALLGFSVSNSFWILCLLAVPLGLGAGAVDAGLNNYVAVHYTSKYMSWLHCFWGLGAAIGPYIMGAAIGAGQGWRAGYGTVGIIQLALSALLFATLPLWKRQLAPADVQKAEGKPLGILGTCKIPGVREILLAFFAYCSIEGIAFLWSGSYLVEHRGVDPEKAADFVALFYLGLTAGRFAGGFVADRFGDKNMIRLGACGMAAGLVLMALPTHSVGWALAGLIVLGLGAAPIYPSIIHATPSHFGPENSQAIVGIQMAAAYTGCTFVPPVFGLLAQHVSIGTYPWVLGVFLVAMVLLTERLNGISLCNN